MSTRMPAILAAVAATFYVPSALGQTTKFPERQIRFIIPFAPGGGVDATARIIAQQIQEKQGAQVIVENRAGSNGTIGGIHVQQAAPDGYTLLYSAATHAMARYVMSKAPYDPVTDFSAIARIGEAPLLVVVSPRLSISSLKELADEARKNPDKWTAATPNLGSPGHLATLLFGNLAGIKLTILPFRGTAPALNDVAGGHVPMLIDAAIALLPMAQGGAVKPLAITTAKRSAFAPEIRTSAESGMPGLEYATWYGFWGPKGVPGDVVARLNAMINRAVGEIGKEGRFAKLGVETVTETPDQFAAFMKKDIARNAELLKAASFKPE